MPRVKTQAPTVPDAAIQIPDSEVPDFSVVERRIKHGDAHVMSGAVSLELVNQPEPMTLRWGNMQLEGRNNYLQKYKGWVPVRMTELARRLDAGILTESPEGYVTRGEKGTEVLYKMPSRLYLAVQQRKVDDNLRRSRSAKHLKEQTQAGMVRDAEAGSGNREQLLRGSDRLGRLDVELNETVEHVEIEG
jgi:hypothetical protein